MTSRGSRPRGRGPGTGLAVIVGLRIANGEHLDPIDGHSHVAHWPPTGKMSTLRMMATRRVLSARESRRSTLMTMRDRRNPGSSSISYPRTPLDPPTRPDKVLMDRANTLPVDIIRRVGPGRQRHHPQSWPRAAAASSAELAPGGSGIIRRPSLGSTTGDDRPPTGPAHGASRWSVRPIRPYGGRGSVSTRWRASVSPSTAGSKVRFWASKVISTSSG